jgi:hypothetical protein
VVARALADESGDLEFVGAVMDITRRKRAEEAQRVQEREREEMQRQLQQAAKMEAIGRLAGMGERVPVRGSKKRVLGTLRSSAFSIPSNPFTCS